MGGIDGRSRQYVLTLSNRYDVNAISFEVQHPFDASEFSLTPAGGEEFIGEFELTSTQVILPAMLAGESLELGFQYEKASDVLSIEQVQGNSPLVESQPEPNITPVSTQGTPSSGLIAGLTGLALIVIAVATYWYTNSQKTTGRASSRKKAQNRQFCTQCGKPVQASDKFCRHCGTAL